MATDDPASTIAADAVPRESDPAFQHLLDTYASEINKEVSVWRGFDDDVLEYRPHPKSTTVGGIFTHELLSGRRFFGEFLGLPEPDAAAVVPAPLTVDACVARLAELAAARLPRLAGAGRARGGGACRGSRRRSRRGGRRRWRSSTSSGRARGCSGGVCCTPRITARS